MDLMLEDRARSGTVWASSNRAALLLPLLRASSHSCSSASTVVIVVIEGRGRWRGRVGVFQERDMLVARTRREKE